MHARNHAVTVGQLSTIVNGFSRTLVAGLIFPCVPQIFLFRAERLLVDFTILELF